MSTSFPLYAIGAEVDRQRRKWGQQNHDDGYWLGIVTEELGEAAKAYIEGDSTDALRKELVHVAAVCVSWIDCIDRREEVQR